MSKMKEWNWDFLGGFQFQMRKDARPRYSIRNPRNRREKYGESQRTSRIAEKAVNLV
jgi:hypothetical protein